mgnify:CR=1 FL=1
MKYSIKELRELGLTEEQIEAIQNTYKEEAKKFFEETAKKYKDILAEHELYATGTTGTMIMGETKLDIFRYKSGPEGGDQQIGAMIAEGKLDVLIFFCDNLITQGHQQDVGALSRLASLYNIPFATNRTTADMLVTSPLICDEEYERIIPSAIDNYKRRM